MILLTGKANGMKVLHVYISGMNLPLLAKASLTSRASPGKDDHTTTGGKNPLFLSIGNTTVLKFLA